MIEGILTEMAGMFQKGTFSKKTTYFFSVGDTDITVTIDADCYDVKQGKPEKEADCYCKTSEEMFNKIWFQGYIPGIMDFFGGAIKTNDPFMLQQFVKAFGK